jgi:endonuclease YncB( thermonuclease family)
LRRTVSTAAALIALAAAAAALVVHPTAVRVARVLDGDSIVLTDGQQVRYLGINTPDAGEPFSKQARTRNRHLVEGKRVRLVRDHEHHDRYGRLLAYVYVDDQFINAELLRAGLAHLLIFRPLREEHRLAALEREARAARRGMWGPGGPVGPLKITAPRRRRPRQRPAPTSRSVTICNIGGREIDVQGFTLETHHARFAFPSSTLQPGHVALIVSRRGQDRLTGPGPRRFHWTRGLTGTPATWLTLRSPAGQMIDRVWFGSSPMADGKTAGKR